MAPIKQIFGKENPSIELLRWECEILSKDNRILLEFIEQVKKKKMNDSKNI